MPPTPPSTLRHAREIAFSHGLQFVYTGNVHDLPGDTTICPGCGSQVITRDWYRVLDYRLTAEGCCPRCGMAIPGRFSAAPGDFGSRRVPVHLATR